MKIKILTLIIFVIPFSIYSQTFDNSKYLEICLTKAYDIRQNIPDEVQYFYKEICNLRLRSETEVSEQLYYK
jgi:hypothetical protein